MDTIDIKQNKENRPTIEPPGLESDRHKISEIPIHQKVPRRHGRPEDPSFPIAKAEPILDLGLEEKTSGSTRSTSFLRIFCLTALVSYIAGAGFAYTVAMGHVELKRSLINEILKNFR